MYRSSSKRKLHILKYHPGEELPPSSVTQKESKTTEDPTYSQTVGAITTYPHPCKWCYRQYASRARLLRHERHQHPNVGGESSSVKDYGEDMPEPGGSEMDPHLDGETEFPPGNQVVTDGSLLQNHQFSNLPRGEPSTSGVQSPEDDLLTQAMGEITPIGNGEQYVRLIGTGTEGQQVMVGTTQANHPLLVNNEEGQKGTTLALVTTDSADTVTLSLPAGQFISLIPNLSLSSPASEVTSDSRGATNSRETDQVENDRTHEEEQVASQDLQGEILSTIRVSPSLDKEETIEHVVLATHQSSQSTSVVWPQALSFPNTSK